MVEVINHGFKSGQGEDDDRRGFERSGECRRVKGLEIGVKLKNWCSANKLVGELEGMVQFEGILDFRFQNCTSFRKGKY